MKILIPLLALLLGACSSVGKDPTARCESEFPEHDYLIILKGTRALMVHDPISAIFDRTYGTEAHIRVKKNAGRVSAAEAQIIELNDFGDARRVRLIEGAEGSLTFTDDHLVVNLKVPYDTGTGNTLVPFYFNGSYSLDKW